MNKIILRACTFFLLMGFIAGPVYHLSCRYLSGKKIDEQVLFSQDLKKIEVANFKYSSMKHFDSKQIELQLDPAMNPVGLIFKGKYVKPTIRRSTEYSLSLSKDNKLIWESSYLLNSSGNSKKKKKDFVSIGKLGLVSFTSHVGGFDVKDKGTYALSIKRKTGNLLVSDMKVITKEKIVEPKKVIYATGYICLVLSLIVSIGLAGKRKQPTKSCT